MGDCLYNLPIDASHLDPFGHQHHDPRLSPNFRSPRLALADPGPAGIARGIAINEIKGAAAPFFFFTLPRPG